LSLLLLQEDIQTNAQATVDALATNAERLLILFDDILTADEITRTSIKINMYSEIKRMYKYLELPPVKQPLGELIRRQQAGRPLEDAESVPLLERKQGHWPGMFIFRTIKTLSNDQFVRILWYTLAV
jgi:hypothetical protein